MKPVFAPYRVKARPPLGAGGHVRSCNARSYQSAAKAFTLVELLAVIGVMVFLMTMVTQMGGRGGDARKLKKSADTLMGALEQGRTYAMANNTYTWVGFFEEKGDVAWTASSVSAPGTGRVVAAVVASKTGLASALTSTTGTDTMSVTKLQICESTHLANAPFNANLSDLNAVTFENIAGSFKYAVGGVNNKYTFDKVVQFNSLGEATGLNGLPIAGIIFGVTQARGVMVPGDAASTASAIDIYVNGFTGRARLLRK